jgi:hypothetical protein
MSPSSRSGRSFRRGSRPSTGKSGRRASPTRGAGSTPGAKAKKSSRSRPEEILAKRLASESSSVVLTFVEEHRFHPTRKWRFDFAWPIAKVALEVEGGAFTRGRHVRPSGFIADCEKYSEAALLGWTVLRVVPRKDWVEPTVALVKRALGVAE